MAAPLIDVVDHHQKKKLFKSPDIFLAPFTKYLLWPPVFGDQGAQSLCFMHNKEVGTDLYCSAGMRERVRQPLPVPGFSTVALLEDLSIEGVVRQKRRSPTGHTRTRPVGRGPRRGILAVEPVGAWT